MRDDIQALRTALEKQSVVLGEATDCDVIALSEDQLEAAAQVFYVRGGRIRGQRGWVVDKVEDVGTGELVERFLAQAYGGDGGGPEPNPPMTGVRPGRPSPARYWSRPSRPTATPWSPGSASAAVPPSTCGCPSAATRRR